MESSIDFLRSLLLAGSSLIEDTSGDFAILSAVPTSFAFPGLFVAATAPPRAFGLSLSRESAAPPFFFLIAADLPSFAGELVTPFLAGLSGTGVSFSQSGMESSIDFLRSPGVFLVEGYLGADEFLPFFVPEASASGFFGRSRHASMASTGSLSCDSGGAVSFVGARLRTTSEGFPSVSRVAMLVAPPPPAACDSLTAFPRCRLGEGADKSSLGFLPPCDCASARVTWVVLSRLSGDTRRLRTAPVASPRCRLSFCHATH